MSENTITVAGNITNNLSVRYSAEGRASVYGVVAVNRRYQAGGEWQESTSFLSFKAFGPIAENIGASVIKGTRVIITGRCETGEFMDKAGVNHKSFDIIVEDFGVSLKFAAAQVERIARENKVQTKPASDFEEPF